MNEIKIKSQGDLQVEGLKFSHLTEQRDQLVKDVLSMLCLIP